ncbi:MAG TPA: hypothetical protein VFN78_02575 [Ktedonobacterales bacterium]|nr:hypothetical protein [Ktedonobacterales bacterium]
MNRWMNRWIDPTDCGVAYPDAQRADARYPADQLPTLQAQRGICSMLACRWPIARWCEACGVKLCYDHLRDHPCSAR